MAGPFCSTTTLTSFPQFSGNVINEKQWLAFKIWYAANELSVIGGPDYTNLLSTTLIRDANTLFQNFNGDQLKNAELVMALDNAAAAGANVSPLDNTTIQNVACLVNADMVDLQKVMLFLTCRLGYHADYPQ